mmetsp:Transcript_32108/g.73437  ORF Transcript_32108/g.73437 Transcript_32108/m.73437 type:complete len:220 (+) Transcript_32108:452-1111(+)
MAVAQDGLIWQLLASLDDGAILKGSPIRCHPLPFRVQEDIGYAYPIRIIGVTTIKCADGAIGALSGHAFCMHNAIKESHNSRSTTCHAKLTMSWVNASSSCHGHTQIVSASAVAVQLRLYHTVGMNRVEERLRDIIPIEQHGVKIRLRCVGVREEVRRHKRHRVGPAANSRRSWRLVNVDDTSSKAIQAEPAGSQHACSTSVCACAGIPEFLGCIGKPI